MGSSMRRTPAAVGIEVTALDRKHSWCDAISKGGSRVRVAPSHSVIGTLCVSDSHPRQLEAHQIHTLHALAATVRRARTELATGADEPVARMHVRHPVEHLEMASTR